MATRIQIRRDTSANWSSANPILAEGEIGYEIDTKRIKIGDGSTPWNELDYTFENFYMGKSNYDSDDDGKVDNAEQADNATTLQGHEPSDFANVNHTHDLNELNDVTISSPSNGQALVYDSNNNIWKNGDVSGSSGDMYKSDYDPDNDGKVEQADYADTAGDANTLQGNEPSAFADANHTHSLGNLDDVQISNPSNGQALMYQDGNWGNMNLPGGGDMLKSVYDTDDDGKVDSAEQADNAQTLQGYQPSDFATADHNHNLSNLADVDNTDKGDGKVLQWNESAGKHIYIAISGSGSNFDYVDSSNPTIDVNPTKDWATWLNTTTGEIFVCIDKTSNHNRWQGQLGTFIWESEDVLDIFGDGSCIALYRFEGNANDESGNYNGTWSGTEQYDTGVFGQAAKFDSSLSNVLKTSYEFLSRTNNVSSGTTISGYYTTTFSAWMKITDGTDLVLYNTGGEINGYGIGIRKLQPYVAIQNNNTFQNHYVDFDIQVDTWYHLCFIFDESDCSTKVYVNGSYVGKFTPTTTVGNRSSYIDIGSINSSDNTFYDDESTHYNNGLIDQFRIFNRALTKDEVQQLYNEF